MALGVTRTPQRAAVRARSFSEALGLARNPRMKVRARVAGENLRRRLTTGTSVATSSASEPKRACNGREMDVMIGMGKLLTSDRRVVIQPTMVEGLPPFFKPLLP